MSGTDEGAVGGLLLAAGGGSRLGRPKALVELGGRRLVEHGLDLLARAGLTPQVVVLGAAAGEVRRHVELTGVEVVVNPDWQQGMGGSLRRGLAALDGRVGAVVVTLVDQPLIGPGAVSRLLQAWREGAPAAVATYRGRPRNPVLLDAALWPEIVETASGDRGARVFLRSHPELVTHVACDDTGSPDDIDTPEDLERISRRAGP